MPSESKHISISIERPMPEVYAFVCDPANLPRWATGLSGSIRHETGRWIADSPMGEVVVAFAEHNRFGVLDHDVTLPSGETVSNPMRAIADGDGCEVVFTLRRQPGMSEADFARDADTVAGDHEALKDVLEGSRIAGR